MTDIIECSIVFIKGKEYEVWCWNKEGQILKMEKLKSDDNIALGLLLIVYGAFNILLIGKFFPVTEGWFQDYANYMNNGQEMYNDFYMFIPPGFPWLMTLLSKLFGNYFIVFRMYGVLERLLLIGLTYKLFRHIFSTKITFFATFIAGIVYISNIQDVFYGYYQTSLLLGVISLYFCVKIYEKFNEKPYIYAFLFGVFTSVSFLFKQTQGLLLALAIGCMLIAATVRSDYKKLLKCIGVFAIGVISLFVIILSVLAYQGSVSNFINQVFKGATSKGSLKDVLFGFWTRIVTKESVLITVLFGCFIICTWLKTKYNRIWVALIQWISIIVCMIWFSKIVFQSFIQRDSSYPVTPIAAFFLLLIISIFIFAEVKFSVLSTKAGDAKWFVFLCSLGLSAMILLVSHFKISFMDYNVHRSFRQYIIFAIFFIEIIYSLYLLYLVVIKRLAEHGTKLIICVASWAVMYVHGFSYIIEDHSALLSLTFFLGAILSAEIVMARLKNMIVILLSFIMIFSITLQRNWFTYYWWGVEMTNTTYDAILSFDDPLLKGIKGNAQTVGPMNTIYHLIENNKTEDSTLYAFPHMNYFNVMSELPSPTFAKVHYFDVCSDDQAIKDAELLLETPPSFIIWMEFTEEEWTVHEDYFRNGNRSGQREIQDAYYSLINSGEYTLAGVYNINFSDPIYLWIKNK